MPSPGQLTVVVCEDRPELARLVELWLDTDGVETIAVVTTGEEAVAACARRPPDLVILDNQLPGPAGVDVLPALRQVAPHARIVLWTSDEQPPPAPDGPDAFLQKDDFDGLDRVVADVTSTKA